MSSPRERDIYMGVEKIWPLHRFAKTEAVLMHDGIEKLEHSKL